MTTENNPKPFDDGLAAAEAVLSAPPVTPGIVDAVEQDAPQAIPQYVETAGDKKASRLFGSASERAYKELTGDEKAPDLLSDACEALASISLEIATITGKGIVGRIVLVTGAFALVFTPALMALLSEPKKAGNPEND